MRFAGEWMQKIRLQKPVRSRDPNTGQITTEYADADADPNPYASVRDNRGSEAYQADQKVAINSKYFQIHVRDDINETWTIVDEDESRRYDIIRIHKIGNRKLDIEANWTDGQYDYPNDVHVPEPEGGN